MALNEIFLLLSGLVLGANALAVLPYGIGKAMKGIGNYLAGFSAFIGIADLVLVVLALI